MHVYLFIVSTEKCSFLMDKSVFDQPWKQYHVWFKTFTVLSEQPIPFLDLWNHNRLAFVGQLTITEHAG